MLTFKKRVAVGDALPCRAVNIPPDPETSLPTGKIPVGLLADLLSELPSSPPELLLGPRIGEDACAIRVPGGVLVAATDPITLTSDQIGRFSVIVNANDVAVMGVRPQWFLAVVLVPAGTTQATIRELFASMRRSLVQIGAHLVGGHTEVTSAVTQPLVVGQMLGLAETGTFVTTGGVRPGDIVVQVGPTPIEGAALLAREAADLLGGLDPAILKAAREALDRPGIAVVEQALLAAGLGATALHDPTEGGLASGLHEMAGASRVCLRIDREAILWFEPGALVCSALGADPWATIASGTLLAAFPSNRADAALSAFSTQGHPAAAIGIAESGSGVRDRESHPLPWPDGDEVARLLSRDLPAT
jgi:hydrogenase maturation factor